MILRKSGTVSTIAASLLILASHTFAADDAFSVKRSLKSNMTVVYNVVPGKAGSFTQMFSQGIVYGRVRANSFHWDWKHDDVTVPDGSGNDIPVRKDNRALGVGGSLIYKTASFRGVSAGAGLYYTDNPFPGERMPREDIAYLKAGKDTLNRAKVYNEGIYSFAVPAQLYMRYDISKTSLVAGRQIFESFLTKSNDTKMIPNTFEGYSLTTKEIPGTRIRAAWFYQQKLRDHDTFHDVLTVGIGHGIKGGWKNNDDSAAHKGLTYSNLKAAGKSVNNSLIVADMRNTSITHLKLDLTYGAVPNMLSSLTGEVNYSIPVGEWKITPGARYMYQMDDGAGSIGGACISGVLAKDQTPASNLGYKNRFSLDGDIWMARLVAQSGPLKLQVAYSSVADKGDIVAPWRGFPTGGYTRAMGQYNWRANTQTTAMQVKYDFDKAHLVSGLSAMVRYAMQDFDEDKQAAGGQADSNIIHIDIIEKLKAIPGMEAKMRVGLVDAKKRVKGPFAGEDIDSYNEYRIELNYLF